MMGCAISEAQAPCLEGDLEADDEDGAGVSVITESSNFWPSWNRMQTGLRG